MLPKLVFKTLTFLLLTTITFKAHAIEFRVLQFNIWQEGTVVAGGFDAIVDEIIANKADVVTFSEVRNYKNTRFNERIVAALKARGELYYSFFSYDSGILSRYPISSHTAIMPEKEDHGSVYKAVLEVNNQRVAVYTAHLDYLNAANYLPRGYDGNTWKKTSKATTEREVLDMNNASGRDEAIALILKDAVTEQQKKAIVFIGGDFNEPSHLDWAKNTRNLFDHNGLVVRWPNTIALTNAGFIDTYRKMYPNVITHPGFTFPAYNKDIAINKLIWAPEADDRDRIDFIFYQPHPQLRLITAAIVGPSMSIVNSQPVEEQTADPFIAPKGIWPTDHKAILATFIIK